MKKLVLFVVLAMVSTASYSDPSPHDVLARLKSRTAKSRSYKENMKSKNARRFSLRAPKRSEVKVPHWKNKYKYFKKGSKNYDVDRRYKSCVTQRGITGMIIRAQLSRGIDSCRSVSLVR